VRRVQVKEKATTKIKKEENGPKLLISE